VKGIVTALLLDAALLAAQSTPGHEQWITTIGPGNAEIVKLDSQGHIFVAGNWASPGFPVTANAFAPNSVNPLHEQGFLLELDASGSNLLYATFLNGINPKDFVIDSAGFVYVIADHLEPNLLQLLIEGETLSDPTAITPGAAQTAPGVVSTPVLLRIAPSGGLVYGTFFGGISAQSGGVAVDSSGAAVVCGTTSDPGLPVSPGAFQPSLVADGNAFVARISPDGSAFEALTYFGGAGVTNCRDVKLDAGGNVVLYGDTDSQSLPLTAGAYQQMERGSGNLFAAKLDPNLQHLIWSTYIGSSGTDKATSLRIGSDGSLLLTGTTASMDFPAPPGTAPPYVLDQFPGVGNELATRPFAARLNSSGTQLISAYVLPLYGFWLGQSDAGDSFSAACWGMVSGVIQNTTLNAPVLDASSLRLESYDSYPFLVRFDSGLQAPTYLGPITDLSGLVSVPIGVSSTSGGDVILAGIGLGSYGMTDVPVQQVGPQTTSAVVSLEFSSSTEKTLSVTQVINPASVLAGPPAPGQLIEVRGFGWDASSTMQVLIDGQPVPVLSVQTGSVVAVTPAALGATFMLAVQSDGVLSDARTVATSVVNPALFTAAGTGSGPALALNPDGTSNVPGQPVGKGNSILLIATGLGAADASGRPLAQITAQIGGLPARVVSVASAGGYPAGYYAVQVVVPATAPTGDFVPVDIELGGTISQPGVTMAVR
jgi:uncharacterized protein (TIGR03437 family)